VGYLCLRSVTKSYDGKSNAVDDVSIDIERGEFITFLGPSGSGKTTTLMMIAGFEIPTGGVIELAGHDLALSKPYQRNIGMVFQNYALFPHMTALRNVIFPLRMRGLARADTKARADKMLDLVGLSAFAGRYPRELSGGQQQRVALARGLVFNPDLVLLDEPLGALDKKLREQMQVEIKRIHRSVGTTVIYVTHDQTEALTMSDLVVVMHQARVAQVGTPRELYEAPTDLFVADFLGDSNLLAAQVVEASGDEVAVQIANGQTIRAVRGSSAAATGARVVALIRPEDMAVCASNEQAHGQDVLSGTLRDISYHGDTFKLDVAVGDELLTVKVARAHGAAMSPGQDVFLSWKPSAVRVLPAADGDGR